MIKVCEGPGCVVEFDAKRGDHSKYHSDTCRKRAQRNPADAGPKKTQPKPRKPKWRVTELTRDELETAGRLDTSAGQVALVLADRLDAGGDTLAAVASASTAHASAMSRALREAEDGDPVKPREDEVKKRRERRSSPAG